MNLNLKNKTAIFLALFFISLSFGQLEKIQLYSSIAIYIHEVVMGVWLGYWVVVKPQLLIETKTKIQKMDKLVLGLLAWILLGWIISFFNHVSLLDSVFYSVRLLFYGSFFWSLRWLIKKKFVERSMFKIGLCISGIYLLYFGFLQYVFLPDTRFLQFLGWDDHYYRLISTILDPGFTGILFILNIFLLFQLKPKLEKFHQFLLPTLLSLFTIGIAFTYSRATYLAYGVSALLATGFYFWQKQKKITYLLSGSLILLAILIPFLPRPDGEGVKLERTSTIISRTSSVETTLSGLRSWQWVTGKGLFAANANQLLSAESSGHNRVPDNWLVMLLNGTGIVGTLLFVIILIKSAQKNWSNNPWFWLALIAVLIHGLFNASLIYVFVLIWLGILSLGREVNS